MRYTYDYVKVRDKHFPLIPLKLGSGNNIFETFALIDSGASLSLFRIDIGHQLGIEIESGAKHTLEGISGNIIIYEHDIPISVEGMPFNCKVGFSEAYSASFNILGRDNFFTKFLITFDEFNNKVILETR